MEELLQPYYDRCDQSRADEKRLLVYDIIAYIEVIALGVWLIIHCTQYSFFALMGTAILIPFVRYYRRKMMS